ncbi:putative lactose permease [Phaeomoniella chlamydospora]|uniref:Putative lactose permease n=1 Tax=Phaeomoniella chlamydospora TaxID=158046 RepID=A0A0G2E0C2_PHACM|nr:putative lactose permease [Phaeomoniella chlamydospora]
MSAAQEKSGEVSYHENKLGVQVDHTIVVSGNEAFKQALIQEPPKPYAGISIYLYLCCILGFFCSTMNGYDGSLLNSLLESKTFLQKYHGENSGIWAGIVTNMYTIGGVVALPFIGPALDTWGRRWGMFIGCFAVVVGTIIMGASSYNYSVGQFMGGRFFAGWGVAVACAAGPIYVVEVSHPAYRSIVGGFYNTFWFTGSILSAGVTRGTENLGGNKSWTVSLWFQLFFPALVCLFCLFLPESPRWLYVSGQLDKAKAVLTKFHGYGNSDSVWVSMQLSEYEEYLELNGSDKRWWDYRALFKTRSSVNRLFCNCAIQAMGQEAGNGQYSIGLSAAFETAGFTDTNSQHNLTLGNACQQFFFAMVGASLVDKVGRRPLLIFSNLACSITWAAMCIAASVFASSGEKNVAAGNTTLAFQFIFGAVFSIGFTPLQALYPVEVLNFEIRAKAMAFGNLIMNIVMIFNNYVWPVCLKAIGWHSYIIFCLWCSIQAIIIYFFIPETKQRTLEELDKIFSAPRLRQAVKISLEKHEAGVTNTGEVMVIDEKPGA